MGCFETFLHHLRKIALTLPHFHFRFPWLSLWGIFAGNRANAQANDWNPSLYDQKHAYISEYGKALISILAPRTGELVLDVGCGTGHLAKAIAEAGARVIGIDSSASMIETARKTYPGIEFLVADARDFSFPAPFDAVFSNARIQGLRFSYSPSLGLAPWKEKMHMQDTLPPPLLFQVTDPGFEQIVEGDHTHYLAWIFALDDRKSC